MARITVEDCLDRVPNRFELVMVAAKRARELEDGEPSMLERENDKSTVLALREIAEGHIDASILENRTYTHADAATVVDTNDDETV